MPEPERTSNVELKKRVFRWRPPNGSHFAARVHSSQVRNRVNPYSHSRLSRTMQYNLTHNTVNLSITALMRSHMKRGDETHRFERPSNSRVQPHSFCVSIYWMLYGFDRERDEY